MAPLRTIGFVTTSFPRFDGDSAGSFVLGMAQAMVNKGHRVEVVVPESTVEQRVGDFAGISVHPVPYMRPRRFQTLFFGDGVPDNLAASPRRMALIPGALTNLFRVVRRQSIGWDAAISHWLVPSGLMTGLALRRRIPHIVVAHSGDVHLLRRIPGGASLAKIVSSLATASGFISLDLEKEFATLVTERQRERHFQTPMGFFPEEFTCARSREQLRAELRLSGFTLLFLGRLVPIKGLDVLLRALQGVPDAQIVVAGDGSERQRLEGLADALKVRARFVGAVDRTRRAELFAACDALIVPSRVMPDGRHEGLPLTVIEGCAAGIPVIASNTGAIHELLTDGVSGLLVAPDDATALRRAILRLARSEVSAASLVLAAAEAVASRDWHVLVDDVLSRLFNS